MNKKRKNKAPRNKLAKNKYFLIKLIKENESKE